MIDTTFGATLNGFDAVSNDEMTRVEGGDLLSQINRALALVAAVIATTWIEKGPIRM